MLEPNKIDKSKLVFDGYELPEEREIIIDKETGKAVENVTPYDKLKAIAESAGIKIQKPNKNCNKCYGRGYISYVYNPIKDKSEKTKTKKKFGNKIKTVKIIKNPTNLIDREPVPCSCIFTKEQLQNSFPTFINRAERRRLAKYSKRNYKKILNAELKSRKNIKPVVPEINILNISADK